METIAIVRVQNSDFSRAFLSYDNRISSSVKKLLFIKLFREGCGFISLFK